uniref:Uncharacterized protein n=1 Tax=Peronospora matthiolae TaxID=2874970 RepID=A0AAV1VFH1_9STRA
MAVKFSFKALAKVTRAALKIWHRVAKYTTKPLLSQGVDGDMAMAQDSRRVFDTRAQLERRTHIAFDDKLKLLTPDEATVYPPPASPTKVVALANWEAAPTFVLDDHLGNGFPRVSADRLLNKCNPFLSGKRRARSDDDTTSDAQTASTDGSIVLENGVKTRDDGTDEVDIAEKRGSSTHQKVAMQAKGEQISAPCFDACAKEDVEAAKPSKRPSCWVCVGHGRYVKRGRPFPRKLCRLSPAKSKVFVGSAIGTGSE